MYSHAGDPHPQLRLPRRSGIEARSEHRSDLLREPPGVKPDAVSDRTATMSEAPKGPPQSRERVGADGQETDTTRRAESRARDAAEAANGDRRRGNCDRSDRLEPTGSGNLRRLGPIEYALFVLIALGIAVTVTMALVNP